jgi:membrane protease YdiL (CAAX protease family)
VANQLPSQSEHSREGGKTANNTLSYLLKEALSYLLDGALFLGISLWVVRASGRDLARRSIRLPEPRFATLGAAIAVGLARSIPLTGYVLDRAQWATHGFRRFAPPQMTAYFDSINPWVLLMAIGAFAEEVIFRGVLQPRFMERYGVQRGIFLTTIAWAAIHFRGDSYGPGSDGAVLFHLGSRILTCVALGYVFAWLTLQSGSIIPSGISHAVHNVLVFSQAGQTFPGSSEILIGLWGVTAYLLFRRWPVREGSWEPEMESPVSEGAL